MTRALWLVLSCALGSCAHVCAKTWETGASVDHSVLYGPMYGTHLTIGGELGQGCREKTDEGDE